MEDRYRFRSFHKPTNKIFDVYGFNDDFVFEDKYDGVLTSPTNPAKRKDCVLMQCTGLKDKKGNLIYEGDIVTKLYITPDGRITNETDRGFIKEITFFKGCFGIFGKTNFYPLIEYVDYHQGHYISNAGNVTIYDNCFLEVIGNIHKNKELL